MGNLFSIAGKTAIVTGASYGLGRTMAQSLAEAGANVVITARSADKVGALARQIANAGGSALALACDVTDPNAVKEMVSTAWEHFGRVDILVNNAGVSAEKGALPEKVPAELFEQAFRVNLFGTFYCCQEVGRRMLRDGKGGSIINIASIMGLAGSQNAPVGYQASKAAVINLTRGLACSWADRQVRVNCIAPGWFPSEMTAGKFAIPQFFERFKSQSPMNRVGNPEELVGPLIFLASDASSFVTGQVLPVDGGLSSAVGAAYYTDELFRMHAELAPDDLGARIMPTSGQRST